MIPKCSVCSLPMQLMFDHPDGGHSYFCACVPGGTWKHEHPVSEFTAQGKMPARIPNA